MIKALAIKELREVLGIVLIALGLYLALVSNLVGMKLFTWTPIFPAGTNEVPFVGSEFTNVFSLISILFVLALGFRQSAWEAGRGTYLFLLHRPIRRNLIFLTKLCTGIGVFLVIGSLPILLYGWWASIPGHHPSPFEWSMTEHAWHWWLLMPLLYLGAFLSGIRPARWYGTRLLPLAACGLAVVLLDVIPWWWVAGLPLTLVLYVMLTASICYAARVRDYS